MSLRLTRFFMVESWSLSDKKGGTSDNLEWTGLNGLVINMEGWMYAVLAIVCWGLEAIIVRAAGDGIDSMTGTGVGCIAAGAIFFVYLGLNGRLNAGILNQSGFYYGLAGIVSFAIGHYLYYTAINKSGVTLSVSLVGAYPLLTVVLAWIIFGEPLTLRNGVGALLIVIGGMVLLG